MTFKNRASIESSKRELTGCPLADTSVVRGGGHDMAQGRTRPSDTEVRTERDSPKHSAPPSRDPTVRRPRPTRLVRCIFHLRCQKRLFAHPRSPPVHPSTPLPQAAQAAHGASRHALKARDAAVVAAVRARDPLAALNRLGAGPAIEYARSHSGTLKMKATGSSNDLEDADRASREPRRRLNMSAAMTNVGSVDNLAGSSLMGSVRTSSATSLNAAGTSQRANSSMAGSSRASSGRTSGRGSRAESDGDDTPRHPGAIVGTNNNGNPADEIQTEFRERLWGYLLNNMVRAVDEVYFLCELECGESEVAAAVSLLEESVEDFRNLAARLRDQEMFTGKGSISWDVGRTDVRPDPRHAEMISALTGNAPTPPSNKQPYWRERKTKITISDLEEDARALRTASGEGKGDGEWQTAGKGGKAVAPAKSKNKNKNKNKQRGRSPARAPSRVSSGTGLNEGGSPEKSATAAFQAKNAKNTGKGGQPRGRSRSPQTSRVSNESAHLSEAAKPPPAAQATSGKPPSIPKPAVLATARPPRLSLGSVGKWADEDGDELPAMDGLGSDDEDGDGGSGMDASTRATTPTGSVTGEDVKESKESNTKTSTKDSNPWAAKKDWREILAPKHEIATRLMNRGGKNPIHAKLMSPERKKRTPMEISEEMRERHERAREARMQLEIDRANRMRARELGAQRELEEAERAKQERQRELEARHRRAEETREERISAVVRKASEETRKVEEIALYNSLDAENKRAALREKLDLAEQRRLALEQERRRAVEAAESAARAAEERRATDEERKRRELEERVREKEARRAQEAAAREAAAAEIESKRKGELADREAARAAKEHELKARAETRRDEMRRRLLAAEERRREYLNLVRDRATGSAVKEPRSSAGPKGDRPEAESPSSPSRPTRLYYDCPASPSRQARESPSKPGTQAAAEAAQERRAAALADRHRAMRKRAKKLRQRLANTSGPIAWTREDGPDGVGEEDGANEVGAAPLPACVEAAKPRLVALASAVAKRKQDAMASAHKEVNVALAEAGAAAASAGCEENSKAAPGAGAAAAALAAAVTGGLVRSLAESLAESLAASATGGGFVASPAAAVTCVSLALALDAATANSPLAAEHLLVENLVAPLVPHLVAGLGLVGDPAAAAEATPGAGGGVPPPTAALEPLIHIVTRVLNGPNAFLKGSNGEGAEEGAEGTAAQRREVCARSAAMRADFVELLVASGAVDALASLFALHDRPKQEVEPVPPAILAGLRMLEALLDARVPAPGVELGEDHASGIGSSGGAQSKTTFVSDCESPAGSLIAALRETALAGLPSLLTSVLLQTEATLRTPVLADPAAAARALPPNFVGVASSVLRLLNATARFGPTVAQDALSSPDLRVETHHLLSFILALCISEWDSAVANGAEAEKKVKAGKALTDAPGEGRSDNARATAAELEDLLDQTVLFIGAFALLCPANQDMLCWGRAPTLMQRLPDLPFEYYSSPTKIAVLFPTLVSVAFGHATNRRLIAHELSLEMVRDFVREETEARSDGVPGAAQRAGVAPQFAFAARFPRTLWSVASEYFEAA